MISQGCQLAVYLETFQSSSRLFALFIYSQEQPLCTCASFFNSLYTYFVSLSSISVLRKNPCVSTVSYLIADLFLLSVREFLSYSYRPHIFRLTSSCRSLRINLTSSFAFIFIFFFFLSCTFIPWTWHRRRNLVLFFFPSFFLCG